MNKIFLLSLFFSFITFSCSDPNTIGLELQPVSDNIIIGNTTSFKWQNFQTESEDSLRTDEALNLILGEINDIRFGTNKGSFCTQMLLVSNNIDLGENPIVDSVILSYSYTGYYGDLNEFTNLEISELSEGIFKDSIYYSNSFDLVSNNMLNVDTFYLSNTITNPSLRIKLKNEFGQQILNLGNAGLVDNETFLQSFNGISVVANAENTLLYLNPDATNSYFKIFYHNDATISDTLSLDFSLSGDAARINLFNQKNQNNILEDSSKIYIQSMAGYKAKISITNVDSIRSLLNDKVINKVTMSFDVDNTSISEYEAHEKLVLVRVNDDGENIFLSDFLIEGNEYFGGDLENNQYKFNITRYFYQFLNNDSYTNNLYLLSSGAAVNANRTVLEKDIKLQIYYSKL